MEAAASRKSMRQPDLPWFCIDAQELFQLTNSPAMRTARPLLIHHSALSPDEFSPFCLWLDELLPPPSSLSASAASSSTRTSPPASTSDQDALETPIRVDDIGRFLLEKLHVQEEVWEDVLAIFHPTHRSLQPRNSVSQSHLRSLYLKGGEVFVVFRLIGHAALGKPVHIEGRKLAFLQAPPPLPSTETAITSKPYPPSRSSVKPPPPPQHLARKNSSSAPSSSVGGHRSTPSLSMSRESLPIPSSSPQPPPVPTANPFRRGSQPSTNTPSKPVLPTSKGRPVSSDSDGLRKVTEDDALTVDSSASSSSEDQEAEEAGRRQRWQTPMSGREDSDSKHSGEGIRSGGGGRSSKPTVPRSDTNESFLTVSSSTFSPLVAAKLGLSPHSASLTVGPAASPSQHPRNSSTFPLTINVDGHSSPSSNPFRTRLDSITGLSPIDHSAISPPLPPRPSSSAILGKSSSATHGSAPPLPPRDNSTTISSARASAGTSASDVDASSSANSPSRSKLPPVKPPKPTVLNSSNSFRTTPLIQQSLHAAKGARKQQETDAGKERKFEVIGSSSLPSSGARSFRSGSIAGGSSEGISPVLTGSGGVGGGGAGGKFATVNASIGLGGGTRGHRSHSLVSGAPSNSSFRSPPIIASALPEYPFDAPPPPLSTVILRHQQSSSSSSSSGYPKPPPPPRRNSLYVNKPPPPPVPTSSAVLGRHVSLSAGPRHSSRSNTASRSNHSSGVDPLKDGLRAMEQGVGWLKGRASSSSSRPAGERERLVDGSGDEGEDSGEEERRLRRRELEREEVRAEGMGESWRRLD